MGEGDNAPFMLKVIVDHLSVAATCILHHKNYHTILGWGLQIERWLQFMALRLFTSKRSSTLISQEVVEMGLIN